MSRSNKESKVIDTMKYVYWQDGKFWLGYLEEFPDYSTQGETREELEENLRDIHQELMSGLLPGVRRIAKLKLT